MMPLFWQPRWIEPDQLAALLSRSATGDQLAFAEMYDELSPVVFGIVKRVLRDPAQAEEVTQEVFVNVWRGAARFDSTRGSVRTWVATIAHRRAVDRVRSEQSHRDRQVRDAVAVVVHESGPDDLVVDQESRRAAAAALASLSEAQREALELAFYGGLTQVEVADRLGIALGTAKTRIRDGLLRLRTQLGESV